MSKRRTSLPLLRLHGWGCGILVAMILTMSAAQGAEPESSSVADLAQGNTPVMLLAARIASAGDAGHKNSKWELISSYESVYGRIGRVPAKWPSLVRRVLVCQEVEDYACVQSSMEVINNMGGINTFPLTHLFEVSRFGMPLATVQSRLQNAAQGGSGNTVAAATGSATAVPVVDAPDHNALGASSASTTEEKPSDVPATVTVTAPRPAAKTVTAKTLGQKIESRLGRLGSAGPAGFFLDALFIMVTVSLLLAYFLFSATRARNQEQDDRLRALHEIQRLEDLQTEEKLRMDHALWSEQLKMEVAIEAQKAHAEEILRMAQLAAEEAIQSEKLRAAEALNAEQRRLEQVIEAEQLKTEEAIKAAKSRADQAIDAYDQMAAKELVYAHQQNDELQEALNAEKERREAQELKTEEALQAAEAFKLKEAQLLEVVAVEKRGRASEARQAAEKLKAAQQAAAALQASLAAMRAQKMELERRVEEAMRAAETKIAESQQPQATRHEQESATRQTNTPEAGASSPESIVLKDARG